MQTARRKLAAWALCALLAAGILLSAWFLAREVRHSCTGQNCPVCACLQAAAARLKSGGRPSSPVSPAAMARRAVLVTGGLVLLLDRATPVDRKVRLNN